MIVGYSLSPGGLLLPYHLGVLTSLSQRGYVTDSTPLAGSSAGSIAVTSHATGIPEVRTLDATIRVSDRCAELGGARGRLLPFLREELDAMLRDDAHVVINEREGLVGLAHREIFPNNRPVLATQFETRECLMDAVMDSSTFPFFSTNWPCRLVRRKGEKFPRVVVDGFFSVPRERYGCPDFEHAETRDEIDLSDLEIPLLGMDVEVESRTEAHEEKGEGGGAQGADGGSSSSDALLSVPPPRRPVVDRTVTVSVFPHDTVKLTASDPHDRISPLPSEDGDDLGQMTRLLRLATQPSSEEELRGLYEEGMADAERWIAEEEARNLGKTTRERRDKYGKAVMES